MRATRMAHDCTRDQNPVIEGAQSTVLYYNALSSATAHDTLSLAFLTCAR